MKRSSYLQYDEVVPLGKRGLTVWGYGKSGEFACRLEVNAAGVALYSGTKGRRRVANVSWETLVDKLAKQPR